MTTEPGTSAPLIVDVSNLELAYLRDGHRVPALRGVDLHVGSNQAVGLLGESGSGKTTLARALIGLLPARAAEITGGSIRIGGLDVTAYGERDWRRVRGSTVAMVFQDPLTFLNPVMRLDRQIAEGMSRSSGRLDTRRRAEELLDLVRLPREAARAYAHELSGGMRQRALLAMALVREPRLLIADEPTTALDVTTQQTILQLLADIRDEKGMALLFVSHDLAVISQVCSTVHVMYAGQVIETGSTQAVLRSPRHPYTQGLLRAAEISRDADGRFARIPGTPPRMTSRLHGCAFADRCARCHPACAVMPDSAADPVDHTHRTRCWLEIERRSEAS